MNDRKPADLPHEPRPGANPFGSGPVPIRPRTADEINELRALEESGGRVEDVHEYRLTECVSSIRHGKGMVD